MSPNVAVVLAGGKGTRLAPFTAVFPKPLVPIGDLPILEILVRQLVAAGFGDIVFSTGHLGHLVEAYFHSHPLRQSGALRPRFAWENAPLGTAGPIRRMDDLPENFLVTNGDVFTTLDFGKLFQDHVESGAALSIAVHKKHVRIPLGVIGREGDRVVGYTEKPTFDYEVSMGVYVYNRRAVAFIPEDRYFDFPDLVLSLVAAGEHVRASLSDDDWLDIGNPDDYATAQELFVRDRGRYLKES